MHEEIPRSPLVMVPLHVVGIRVNDERLADVVFAIDLEDDLQVGLDAERDVEGYLAPAQVEFLVEVVDP